MTDETQHDYHPFANLRPLGDYSALIDDIGKHGQRDPIVLWNGQVLDGRHRYLACFRLNVPPVFEDFEGTEQEALAFVLSKNLVRGHLTTSQRAMMIGRVTRTDRGPRAQGVGPRVDLLPVADAFVRAGVGRSTLLDAMKILKVGHDALTALVETGAVSVKDAAAVCRVKRKDLDRAVEMFTEAQDTDRNMTLQHALSLIEGRRNRERERKEAEKREKERRAQDPHASKVDKEIAADGLSADGQSATADSPTGSQSASSQRETRSSSGEANQDPSGGFDDVNQDPGEDDSFRPVQELQEALQTLQAKDKQIADMQETIDELRDISQGANEQAAQALIRGLKEDNAVLKSQLDEKMGKIHELTNENEGLKKALKSKDRELEAEQKKGFEEKMQDERARNDLLRVKVHSLEKEVGQLKAKEYRRGAY